MRRWSKGRQVRSFNIAVTLEVTLALWQFGSEANEGGIPYIQCNAPQTIKYALKYHIPNQNWLVLFISCNRHIKLQLSEGAHWPNG